MFRRVLVIGGFLALAVSPAVGADVSSSPAKLTAEQVIEKNVAARGGLQAWRAVETLSMSGKMDVGGNETPALRVQGVRTGGVQLPKRPAEQMQLPFRLELKRARARLDPGIGFQLNERVRERIKQMLPFKPTGAQKRVLAEIAHDMAAPHPMYRLLQGDVGSGKTLVAAEAAIIAIENGYQVAVLAPTEILAAQHYFYFKKLFQKLG